ncbi:MAG TPA: 50S ribosomal protein L18e [Candidatus Aenigmarchaeota archaeon]|nr:50S ribosomal protein L18e [Candidatus Aenigmarchaeota archaeon]
MKIRDKHESLRKLIEELYNKGLNRPFWKALAKALNKPRRKHIEVNIYKIEKYAKEGDNVVVPGVVLGEGELTKPVNIIALRFSKGAEEKIKKAGGKCIPINEVFKFNPSKLKIMG